MTHVRYDVNSNNGQDMLDIMEEGITEMLKLPPSDPRNWFRYAFTHQIDCPHSNWWFYPWHRGYIGHFESIIRELTRGNDFALPYWDWTSNPVFPHSMFYGNLTPSNDAYLDFIKNLDVFTDFIKDPLEDYWRKLSNAQKAQLDERGYHGFRDLWYDIIGYNEENKFGISGNASFTDKCNSRYPSINNTELDSFTKDAVSKEMIKAGLSPIYFHHENIILSFTGVKTLSHTTPPDAAKFTIIEGQPHNSIHNYVGGHGKLDPGPYGFMANFLSPIDPVFFLHHANVDRLWEVWNKKQKLLDLPILPKGEDLYKLENEDFLQFVDASGEYILAKAKNYLSTSSFDYTYSSIEDDIDEISIKIDKTTETNSLSYNNTTQVKSGIIINKIPSKKIINANRIYLKITVKSDELHKSYFKDFMMLTTVIGHGPYKENYISLPKVYCAPFCFFGKPPSIDGSSTFYCMVPEESNIYNSIYLKNNDYVDIFVMTQNIEKNDTFNGEGMILKIIDAEISII